MNENSDSQLDAVTLSIPSDETYLGLVRLLISGFASKMDFSYDEIEEIKIATSELCLNSIYHAYKSSAKPDAVHIHCKAIDAHSIEISIQDTGCGFSVKKQQSASMGFGFAFLKQYMEIVELHSDIEKGTSITFRKKHQSFPS